MSPLPTGSCRVVPKRPLSSYLQFWIKSCFSVLYVVIPHRIARKPPVIGVGPEWVLVLLVLCSIRRQGRLSL